MVIQYMFRGIQIKSTVKIALYRRFKKMSIILNDTHFLFTFAQ